jgi:hypothetical protein
MTSSKGREVRTVSGLADQHLQYIKLPDRREITLIEAVTAMMHGEAMSYRQMLAQGKAERDRIRHLVDRCLKEAQDDPQYAGFPQSIDVATPGAIIERLDACRNFWPPAASNLWSEATKAAEAATAAQHVERIALEKLHEAAYGGHIQFRGVQRANRASMKFGVA